MPAVEKGDEIMGQYKHYPNNSNADGAVGTISSTSVAELEFDFPDFSPSPGQKVTSAAFWAYMDTSVDTRGGTCTVMVNVLEGGLVANMGRLVTEESSGSSVQWRNTGAVSLDKFAAAIKSGVRLNCSSSSAWYGSSAGVRTEKAAENERPYWLINTTNVALTPRDMSPASGELYKGFIYRFSWDTTYDGTNVHGPVTQSSAIFHYRPKGGGTEKTIQVSGGNTHLDFDTTLVESTAGMEWQIEVVSNSGVHTKSSWATLDFSAVNVTVTELTPKGTVYRGFPVKFGWDISYTTPSDVIGGKLKQISASLRWRVKNSQTLGGEYTISGETRSYTLAGDVLPVGSIEWQVTVYTSDGYSVTSSWTSITNSEISVSVVDMTPVSNSKVYRGFDVRFSWGISYKLPAGVSGIITQVSATVRWRRADTPGSVTEYPVSGETKSYTVSGQELPIGELEWQVVVTTSTGSSTESSWVSFENVEVPILISGMYPADGARIIKAQSNRFGWTAVPDVDDDETLPGTISQQSAIMRYRPKGGGAEVEKSVGAQPYVDIPAGEITVDEIEWQVTVVATTGMSATSEWVHVITEDTLSTPVCVSPVGEIVDDKNGITFSWLHVNETGTAQTAWELERSYNAGANYAQLGAGEGDGNTYTVARGTLDQGTVLWRVRTRNSDAAWGTWSEPATIIIQRAPSTPIIAYIDNKPLPTVRWQSGDQAAYRVTIGSYDTGWIYGTSKEYRHTQVLPDGEYQVTVTIRTMFEVESEPASITLTVRNVPGAAIDLQGVEKPNCAVLSWASEDDRSMYYILRDGTPIARTTGNGYTDHLAAGKHTYQIRGFDADGYYTDSAAVVVWSRVSRAVISRVAEIDWLPLRLRDGPDAPEHRSTVTLAKNYTYYFGEELPEEDDATPELQEDHSFTFAVTRDEYARLYDMRVGLVIYKDLYGDLVIGSMTGLTPNFQQRVPVSFSLRRVRYEEAIAYDAI